MPKRARERRCTIRLESGARRRRRYRSVQDKRHDKSVAPSQLHGSTCRLRAFKCGLCSRLFPGVTRAAQHEHRQTLCTVLAAIAARMSDELPSLRDELLKRRMPRCPSLIWVVFLIHRRFASSLFQLHNVIQFSPSCPVRCIALASVPDYVQIMPCLVLFFFPDN